jgi:putative ABC transport system permease protein
MWLARRTLLHQPTQFLLSVLAVGLSVMLVVVLLGVLSGVQTQTGDYLDHAPGSVVVASSGTENFLMVAVPLPTGTVDRVRAVPDVAEVAPLLSQVAVLQLHDRREAAFVIGYDPAVGGGPRQITAGRAPAGEGDIVLGRLLAERHGVEPGDTISVFGRAFSVSGLADDPTPLMTSFVFVTKPALERLLMAPGASSVLLVTPRDGISPTALRAALTDVPGISVLLKQQVIASDVALFTEPVEPVIRLMAGIALLAGTLVVGLLVYTSTLQRRPEYGVLKAIGVSGRALYRIIGVQAVLVAGTGAATGLVLALGVSRLIMALRPEFLIALTWSALLIAAGAGLGMALLAALAPARVIARLAPADIFRR